MADTYKDIRDKIVALRGKDRQLENILRAMIHENGFGSS
jgi:hypothetical protein